MLTRHVIANPTFAVAHPGAALPDLEVEGADIALALTEGDNTVIVIFTAAGGATVAEIILRALHKLGHTDLAKDTIQQAWLESTGGNQIPTVKLAAPKNTITEAKFIK